MEISKHKNSQVMPLIKPYTGLRLPPDRYCLSAPNYRMSSHKAVKKVKSSSSSLCLPHINVWLLCVYTSINLFVPLPFYCIIGIHSHSHSLLLLLHLLLLLLLLLLLQYLFHIMIWYKQDYMDTSYTWQFYIYDNLLFQHQARIQIGLPQFQQRINLSQMSMTPG